MLRHESAPSPCAPVERGSLRPLRERRRRERVGQGGGGRRNRVECALFAPVAGPTSQRTLLGLDGSVECLGDLEDGDQPG